MTIYGINSYYEQTYPYGNCNCTGGYYNNNYSTPLFNYQSQGCNCSNHTSSGQINKKKTQTMAQKYIKQNIATAMNSIRNLEQKLNSMLANNKYSAKQKEQIENNLDVINKAETDLVRLLESSEGKDVSAGKVQEQLNTIERSIRTVHSSIGELGKPNPNALSKEEDKDGDGIKDVATYSDEGIRLAEKFYDAVNDTGWFGIPCTDDEAFEDVCSQLNKNNILDVMLAYNDSHPSESFMEAFMWDADHDQKKTYGKHIRNVLFEKARELGVTKECANDFKEIDEELDDYIISNDIAENFDNIIKIIARAEKQPYMDNAKADPAGAEAGRKVGEKLKEEE